MSGASSAAPGKRPPGFPALTELWATLVTEAFRLHQPEARARLSAFVNSRRHPLGGFRGLDGGPDLYASSFGFELIAAAGMAPAPSVALWLASLRDATSLDLPHLVSLLRCRRAAGLPVAEKEWAEALARFRVGGGRWRLLPDGNDGGPYAAFLAAVGSELVGVDMPPDTADGLRSYIRPDGGLAAVPSGPPTVPVTAAAVATMARVGAAPPPATLDWLAGQRLPAGGWRVSPAHAAADLLATAVAMFALVLAGRPIPGRAEDDLDFVAAHAGNDGGYAQAPGAPSDLESTWYALLAIGSLLRAPPTTVEQGRRT